MNRRLLLIVFISFYQGENMGKKFTGILISFTIISMILSSIVSPLYAMSLQGAAPNNRPISTMEELLQWHDAPAVWNDFPVLSENIIVNGNVTLMKTNDQRYLGTMGHVLYVTSGSSLSIDNSNFIMTGQQTAIVVEDGGQLLLQKGEIYSAPSANAIVVEKGGRFIKSEAFVLEGKVLDQNEEEELPTDPNPPLDPDVSVITNTLEFDYPIACMEGEPPGSSAYPSTKWITYETADKTYMQMELPIQWEIDMVDFDTAGIYTVKGVFSDDVLAANHLSNPNDVAPIFQLVVHKPEPISALSGNILAVGSEGECHIRLEMPALPADVTALHIYRSDDGINWKKAVQEVYEDGYIPSSYDDFLPHTMLTTKKLYVQYYYQTDYRPIWLRVEVVGSGVAGLSNAVRFEMPSSVKPGEGSNTGETGDDDGSGGNRGGGGQSEEEREIPNVQGKPIEKEPTEKELPILKDKPLSNENDKSSDYVSEDTYSSPTGSDDFKSDETIKGKVADKSSRVAAIEEELENKTPVPSIADSRREKKEKVLSYASMLFAEQEGGYSPSEVNPKVETDKQEIVFEEGSNSLPIQKSRGVLITVAATTVAAGILILFRQLYRKKRRNP